MAGFIRDTAALGYALGIMLTTLAVVIMVTAAIVHRRDDGYSPIGSARPTPPRRSPFAPTQPGEDE